MFLDVYGCLWMFMDVYGCLWMFMDVYGVNPLKYPKYIPTAQQLFDASVVVLPLPGGKHILAALAKRKNHGVTVERCFTMEDFSGR